MTHVLSIVQVLVLYVTVLLGVLLYVAVLRRQQAGESGEHPGSKHVVHLTLALVGVITMIFGVGSAHQIWPQANDLWYVLLGILIVCVAFIVYRLRKLSPKTN